MNQPQSLNVGFERQIGRLRTGRVPPPPPPIVLLGAELGVVEQQVDPGLTLRLEMQTQPANTCARIDDNPLAVVTTDFDARGITAEAMVFLSRDRDRAPGSPTPDLHRLPPGTARHKAS
jgi:hypothetical protein